MIQVDISAEFKEVERALGKLNGEVEKAASKAINDSLKKTRTKYKRHVKDFMRLRRVGDAARLLRLTFSRPHTLAGSLQAQGGTAARPSVKHLSGTKELKGSKVKWQTGGRKWITGDSFKGKGKLNGHYYKRDANRNISKILGPSAADAINSAERRITSDAETHTVVRFDYWIDRALRRLGIRK